MKASVYGGFGSHRKRRRGHRRHRLPRRNSKGRFMRGGRGRRHGRRVHHARRRRGGGRKRGMRARGRRLAAASRKASRICRGLLRRGKIHKLGSCFRSELRVLLAK